MSEHDALPRPHHELSDMRFAPMLVAALALAATLLLLAGFAALLFPRALGNRVITGRLPPTASPALQSSPRADMAAFHAREMEQLNSFGWIDRDKGIVHVPIANAMRAVARDGIPEWPTR